MTTRNSHFDSVCIKSTGSYVPSKILTNEEVVANLPTSPQWVVDTLGIRQRHIAEQGNSPRILRHMPDWTQLLRRGWNQTILT